MIGSISKKLIENIAYADNTPYGENIEAGIFNLISLAIEELEQTIPYINIKNTVVQPVNETFNFSYVPGSDFVYFLGIASPQLEINSLTYSNTWSKFKKRFKDAWIESSRRLRKRRERARKLGIEEKEIGENYEKYNIENLLEDLQYAFAKNLSETSLVYKRADSIKIVGKDDFGVNTSIIIFPAILEDKDYKLFVSRKKGFITYNFQYRMKCFNEKLEKIGPNYIFMLKTLNSLIKEFTKAPANQIFVESLLNGCPEEILKGDDIYACFVKLINYLRFTDISSYESVLTEGKTIFNDLTTTSASFQYSKFLKAFDKIKLEVNK